MARPTRELLFYFDFFLIFGVIRLKELKHSCEENKKENWFENF